MFKTGFVLIAGGLGERLGGGGRSRMNTKVNHTTYTRNLQTVDKPLAKFCAEVALAQLHGNLDYANEQPTGSSMYETVEPWPKVCAHPRFCKEICEPCQLGQRNSKGQLVKKSTELRASDPDLLHYFKGLKCGRFPKLCNGIHAELTGHESYRARIWPWALARRRVWGIVRLMRDTYW